MLTFKITFLTFAVAGIVTLCCGLETSPYCEPEHGLKLLEKVIKCEDELIPAYSKMVKTCFLKHFLDSENPDDLKDVAAAHELACDEKHKEKWPLFGSCLKEAQVKSGKPMTEKQVWDKIKDCVGLDEAPLF